MIEVGIKVDQHGGFCHESVVTTKVRILYIRMPNGLAIFTGKRMIVCEKTVVLPWTLVLGTFSDLVTFTGWIETSLTFKTYLLLAHKRTRCQSVT